MSTSKTKGIFLPSTQVWDVNDIKDTDASDSLKELLIRMYQNLGNMATAINSKESAVYDTQEFVTGGVYFPSVGLTSQTVQTPRQRQIVRTVVNFGPLTNVGLNQVAHNIPFNSGYTLVQMYGGVTDATNLRFTGLSFTASLNSGIAPELTTDISLWADGTYVYIDNNGVARPTCTAIVVIEYLKF
jgi:hypothetical protein